MGHDNRRIRPVEIGMVELDADNPDFGFELVCQPEHQDALRRAVDTSHAGPLGARPMVLVWLVPEPLNGLDRHSIAVWTQHGQVGHVPRETADAMAPHLARFVHEREAYPATSGVIFGGDEADPGYSIYLAIRASDMRAANRKPAPPIHRRSIAA